MPNINKFSFSDIIKSGSIIELKAPINYSSTSINYSLVESDSVSSILLLGDNNNLECNELYEYTESEIAGLVGETAFSNITLDKSVILYPSTKNVYCKEYIEADEYDPETEEWDYVTDETKLNALRNFVPRLSYDSTNGIVTIKNISELYNAGFQPRELAAFMVTKRTRVPRGARKDKTTKRVYRNRGCTNTVIQEIFKNVYSENFTKDRLDEEVYPTIKCFGIIENTTNRTSATKTTGYVISDTGKIGTEVNSINDFYASMKNVTIYERYRTNSSASGQIFRYVGRDSKSSNSGYYFYTPITFYGVIVGLRCHKKFRHYDSNSDAHIISGEPEYHMKFRNNELFKDDNQKDYTVLTRLCSYASSDAIAKKIVAGTRHTTITISLRSKDEYAYPYYAQDGDLGTPNFQ